VSQVEGDDAAEGDGVGRDARDGTKNPEAGTRPLRKRIWTMQCGTLPEMK
jgi:hypothetical protein